MKFKRINKYIGTQIKRVIYFFSILPNKYSLQKKIRRVYRSRSKSSLAIDPQIMKKHYLLWKAIGTRPYGKWLRVYKSMTGMVDPDFISEPCYFHRVELILNNKTFSYSYSDKNNYHKIIDNNYLPPVYYRNIEGVSYSGSYGLLSGEGSINEYIPCDTDKIITKTSTGPGGGKSIRLFVRSGSEWISKSGEKLDFTWLKNTYGKNYLIQQYVVQHPFYSAFNDTSLNTIRLLIYRSVVSNEIVPLQAILRIGNKGSVVDNISSGGVACGINADGRLRDYAFNEKGERFQKFNSVFFKECKPLYLFDEIVETGLKIAEAFYYHRLIGFDLCVDNKGRIKLIEVNLDDIGINVIQYTNGPLFREYTKEVIDFCARNKKTICFDFTL